MDVQETLGSLRENGFARIDSALSPDQVDVLREQSDALLRQPAQTWDHFAEFTAAQKWRPMLLAEPGRSTIYFDSLGLSPEIDEVLSGLFENQDLRRLLLAVLGRSRLWSFQIRRAEPHGQALRMHQDIPGEVGLNILLSNVATPHGTTVLAAFTSLATAHGHASLRPAGYVRRFLAAAQGTPGDMYLFYNCVWHGMAGAHAEPSTSIILTFLPAGTRADRRQLPDGLLPKLGRDFRDVLDSRSTQTHVTANGNDDESGGSDFVPGPDCVVADGVPLSIFSLWRLAIAAAWMVSKIAFAGDAVWKRVRR